MSEHIRNLIISKGGPISMADFMTEVHANRHPEVSMELLESLETLPESRILGELLGRFIQDFWELNLEKAERVNLVQLGPGMGVVMAHLINEVDSQFSESLHIHFVEKNTLLRTMQCKALRDDKVVPISFHMELEEVPRGVPCIIIAHNFFSSLPILQFQGQSGDDWLEKLVDLSIADDQHFRFVFQVPAATNADLIVDRIRWARSEDQSEQLCESWSDPGNIKRLELCPKALELTREMGLRIAADGGLALIIDVGENCIITDSLQARREDGQPVDLLEDPGSADLTAYVDFHAIQMALDSVAGIDVIGPARQHVFLHNREISSLVKLEHMCESPTMSREESSAILRPILRGFWSLVCDGPFPDENENERHHHYGSRIPHFGMGSRCKVLAIFPKYAGCLREDFKENITDPTDPTDEECILGHLVEECHQCAEPQAEPQQSSDPTSEDLVLGEICELTYIHRVLNGW